MNADAVAADFQVCGPLKDKLPSENPKPYVKSTG